MNTRAKQIIDTMLNFKFGSDNVKYSCCKATSYLHYTSAPHDFDMETAEQFDFLVNSIDTLKLIGFKGNFVVDKYQVTI